jgi:aspartyl-tRNA(Asn)/glutamyl-tRNA(Gln) amidotransferase subunit A
VSTPKTFSEARAALAQGATVQDLTRAALEAAQAQQHLNAFLELFPDSAMEHARGVDERLRKGQAGPLAGMIIGLKDNICYKDHRVSAASRMLEGYVSPYSATAVERLLAADAVAL